MIRRRPAHRPTLWLFIAVLVLKSAVPMLASASAALQGKGVADVCPLYGVALPAASRAVTADAGEALPAGEHAAHRGGHAPHHAHPGPGAQGATPAHEPSPTHDGAGHRADHCVLTALAAVAADGGDSASLLPAAARRALRVPAASSPAPTADAAARWAARLGHGPPLLS